MMDGDYLSEEEKIDDEGTKEGMDAEKAQMEMARMMAEVRDMALSNISMLATQAWHHLGLVPIPGTGEPVQDLEQAKMAINLFEANQNALSQYLDDNMNKELKRALMDLQMNYVNKSGE